MLSQSALHFLFIGRRVFLNNYSARSSCHDGCAMTTFLLSFLRPLGRIRTKTQGNDSLTCFIHLGYVQ